MFTWYFQIMFSLVNYQVNSVWYTYFYYSIYSNLPNATVAHAIASNEMNEQTCLHGWFEASNVVEGGRGGKLPNVYVMWSQTSVTECFFAVKYTLYPATRRVERGEGVGMGVGTWVKFDNGQINIMEIIMFSRRIY